jgi:hypothetical protein
MVASGQSKVNNRPKKKRKSALLVKDNQGEKVIDRKDSEDEDEVYRLIRGAPSFVVTRSAEESSAYRPKWLRNEGNRAEGMGYIEPPPSTPYDNYCNQNEVRFIVSLMISGKDKEKSYVPSYPDSDSSSSSDSSRATTSDKVTSSCIKEDPFEDLACSSPKFKVGDKVKWKRKSSDLVIQGKGTITRVKLARSVTSEESSSVNTYRYEIASLKEPEPGIWTRKYKFCDEQLIRLLAFSEKLDHEEVGYSETGVETC